MSEDDFQRAKALFLEGTGLLTQGDAAGAEERLAASLSLLPGRPSTLANLGVARMRQGKLAEAVEPLSLACKAEPHAVDTWWHLAEVLSRLGRLDEALGCCDSIIAIDASHAQAWSNRGGLLKDLGRTQEAADSFRQALAHGGDREYNGWFLASLTGEPAPATAPRGYVQGLFDNYSAGFDTHLVEVLHYQGHSVLVEELKRVAPRWFGRALDLGCGTGLCGPLLKSTAGEVDGVDLSSAMVRAASATGAYRQVVQADVAEYVAGTDERYDLVAAADVFIYVGDLEAVFAGVRRVLRTGGVFCFSAELATAEAGYELRPSQRYAHSHRYVRELAARHGFEVLEFVHEAVREEQRQPVEGLFAYLALA
ncbi:MAG: methyltransferase domain-containing protein [Burkholderiaceae bacterium]